MKTKIDGRVYVVGDHINTDVIIAARYLTTMDPKELGKHVMEDLDPKEYPVPFLNKDGSCDYKIILAGKNFGCGSSREHAPIALSAVGIEAVVAESFARIFYRNCVNSGLILPLELEPAEKDGIAFVRTRNQFLIDLSRKGKEVSYFGDLLELGTYPIKPFGGSVKEIVEAGGLTAHNKERLGLK